jgi:hypothetical protein
MKQPNPIVAPTMTSTLATRSIYPVKRAPLDIQNKHTLPLYITKDDLNNYISKQNALQHNHLLNLHLLQ